jgi:hypothetical protein
MRQTPGQAPVRRYPRMAAEYVVAYHRLLPDGGEATAKLSHTRSLGLGGLMFETENPLDVGESLRLEIVIGEKIIKAAAVVIYVDRRAEGLWHNGVQFTDICEDHRDVLLSTYLQREYRITPL